MTRRVWPRLPAALWLLIAARGVNQLGAFTLPFLTVLLIQRLHVNVATAGALMAVFGAATIPGRMLGGHLADFIGRRNTIVIGLLTTAAGQLALALVSSLTAAVIWLLILGLAFEVYEPPSQALVADLADTADRSAAYGAYSAVLAIAGVVAGLIAVLVGHIGLRWLFVVDAGTSAVCATLVGGLLRVPARPGPSVADSTPDIRPSSSWRSPALLAMLTTGTAFAVVYMQIGVLTPLTLAARHLSPSDFGFLTIISALTIIAGQPLLSRHRSAESDPFAAMALSYVLLCAGFLAYGFARSLWEFIGATLVWSIGDLVVLGRAMAVVASISPEGARGRYMSAYGVSWGVAIVIGPVTGTQLFQRWGVLPTWVTIGVLCAILALVQPFVARVVTRYVVQ